MSFRSEQLPQVSFRPSCVRPSGVAAPSALTSHWRCPKQWHVRVPYHLFNLFRFFLTVGGSLGGQILNVPLKCSAISWHSDFVVVYKFFSTPVFILSVFKRVDTWGNYKYFY